MLAAAAAAKTDTTTSSVQVFLMLQKESLSLGSVFEKLKHLSLLFVAVSTEIPICCYTRCIFQWIFHQATSQQGKSLPEIASSTRFLEVAPESLAMLLCTSGTAPLTPKLTKIYNRTQSILDMSTWRYNLCAM